MSPDRPERLEQSLEVKGLGFALYSDSDLSAARQFGIVYQLEDASGLSHRQLPVPSVFLVDPTGTILWVYSNADYTIRPDNTELLEAARRFAAAADG